MARHDANERTTARECREVLDCGDEVCGVAAFDFEDHERRRRKTETFAPPKPKR
jgi:hypothetical protein